MTDFSKATARPWFVTGIDGFDAKNDAWVRGRTIGSVPDGTRVADIADFRHDEGAFADAALIVKAVNERDELLVLLRELTDFLQKLPSEWPVLERAKAFLAKAER